MTSLIKNSLGNNVATCLSKALQKREKQVLTLKGACVFLKR